MGDAVAEKRKDGRQNLVRFKALNKNHLRHFAIFSEHFYAESPPCDPNYLRFDCVSENSVHFALAELVCRALLSAFNFAILERIRETEGSFLFSPQLSVQTVRRKRVDEQLSVARLDLHSDEACAHGFMSLDASL